MRCRHLIQEERYKISALLEAGFFQGAIAAYLETAFEDCDPSLIATALGDIARAMGMTQLASRAGVTREAL
jgi:probable addiction module antidote protein